MYVPTSQPAFGGVRAHEHLFPPPRVRTALVEPCFAPADMRCAFRLRLINSGQLAVLQCASTWPVQVIVGRGSNRFNTP
jgi:hypothetical protein